MSFPQLIENRSKPLKKYTKDYKKQVKISYLNLYVN